ncbi:MAG: glycosyltransferase family 39 protein [Chloroflexi bacterium]|nr:glycosyltransferase family 39 protein [Chloroflexota bacterium]
MQDRLFALLALIAAAAIVFGIVGAPSYTDAYYHFNAAHRLAAGQGLTDPYIWTYIGAASALPMPSHLYWMPMTSVLSGVSMTLLNAPGSYVAAQVPLMLLFWLTACVGYVLGWRLGGSGRHAWVSGLLTLLSPFFVRYWGATDTFAPYAFFGSACLLLTGAAIQRPRLWLWAGCGALAALAHLTRADGLLLLLVAAVFALTSNAALRTRLGHLVVLVAAYLAVMSPLLVRNLQAIGAPLPLGGTQAIWFREYNDIFSYPPDASMERFFADGPALLWETRREALVNNLATVIAVEGVVVLLPLMLLGLWRRRRDRFLHPFVLYALGMHLAMTFIFPYPGYRGGLLHSAAALIPFWSALAVIGLDSAVEWLSRRRRGWRTGTAASFFSAGMVLLAAALAVFYASSGRVAPASETPALYAELQAVLPEGVRVLFDDVPELYYFTGLGGATLPNSPPAAILEIARQYDIDFLVLKNDTAAIPTDLQSIVHSPPDFLRPLNFSSARLYAIQHE